MKKDLPNNEVFDVAIAIVKELNPMGEAEWNAYLINFKEHAIENAIVVVTGQGLIDGELRKTSTMRYFFPLVESLATLKIEPVASYLFELENTYWLSFYVGNQIYDHKFVFGADSIQEWNLEPIPFFPHAKGKIIKT